MTTALYVQAMLIYIYFFYIIFLIQHTHTKCTENTHWPALVSALTHSLVDLEDELQLFVGAEGGERAVHSLARLPSLPVILPSLIHLVTAWSLLIVVPSTRAFFYTHIQTQRAFNSMLLCLTTSHRKHVHSGMCSNSVLCSPSCPVSLHWPPCY